MNHSKSSRSSEGSEDLTKESNRQPVIVSHSPRTGDPMGGGHRTITKQRTRLHNRQHSSSCRRWTIAGFYEIDKNCVKVYNRRFGTNYAPADITKINERDVPTHDVLCGGFPCQAFSIAGKRAGFNDTRGTLFFEIRRIAQHHRTPILFLENVKGLLSHGIRTTGIFHSPSEGTYSAEQTPGSEEIALTIPGETFGIMSNSLQELGYLGEAGVVNSKNFGVPQNRERVFIIATLGNGSRLEIFPFREDGKQAHDKERNAEEQQNAQCLKARDYTNWAGNFVNIPETARTLTGGGHSGGLHSDMDIIQVNNPYHQSDRVYSSDGIAPTLPSKARGNTGTNTPMIEITNGMPDAQRVYSSEGLARTIKGEGGGQGAKTGLYAVKKAIPVLTPDRPSKRQNGRRFKEDGDVSFTLTGQDIHGVAVDISSDVSVLDLYNNKEHHDRTPALTDPCHNNIRLKEGMNIRRLTPTECERLQGFPDGHTAEGIDETGKIIKMADSQRYKQMGNAVTVNVIESITRRIIQRIEEKCSN